MGRLYITNREIDFINDITKELIKDVVGQIVIYYPISEEKTKTNLYNESDQKVFDTPVEIEVLVEYKGETEVTTTKYGVDSIFEITVFFHKKDLSDKSIKVREGDFVQYGEKFYEILKLLRPKDIFGQQQNIPGIHAECRIAREGQFKTKLIAEAEKFTQSRGKAGSEESHDKRALQDNNKIDVTKNKNTSPFE